MQVGQEEESGISSRQAISANGQGSGLHVRLRCDSVNLGCPDALPGCLSMVATAGLARRSSVTLSDH